MISEVSSKSLNTESTSLSFRELVATERLKITIRKVKTSGRLKLRINQVRDTILCPYLHLFTIKK